METITLIVLAIVVSLAIGGPCAAWIARILTRAAAARAEAQLSAARDEALRAVTDRDARLAEMTAALAGLSGEAQTLRVANSALEERCVGIERENRRAIGEKEAALADRLHAKDIEAAERIEMERESNLRLMAEKQASLDRETLRLREAETVLTEKFSKISLESLDQANKQLLEMAGERLGKVNELSAADLVKRQESIQALVKPLQDLLRQVDERNGEIERQRVADKSGLATTLAALGERTEWLSNAFRKPVARGAWAEMNLCAILDQAGFVKGTTYDVQHTTHDDDGRRLRTDVVLHLPGGRDLIIDAKSPMEKFAEAMNEADETARAVKLQEHARLVRTHLNTMASKDYAAQYSASPDCLVMFLPSEGAFLAALEADPTLVADAQAKRVFIACPMLLLLIVHLAAHMLQEERLRDNVKEIRENASKMYDAVCVLLGHVDKLGGYLGSAVGGYNKVVGSLEASLLPKTRAMRDLGAAAREITSIKALENMPRPLASPESRMPVPVALAQVAVDDHRAKPPTTVDASVLTGAEPAAAAA